MNEIMKFKKVCALIKKRGHFSNSKSEIIKLLELSELLRYKSKNRMFLIVFFFMQFIFFGYLIFAPILIGAINSTVIGVLLALYLLLLYKSVKIFFKRLDIIERKKDLFLFTSKNNINYDKIDDFVLNLKKYIHKINLEVKQYRNDLSLEDYQIMISQSEHLSDYELSILEKWFLEFRKNNREAKENTLKNLIKEDSSQIDLLNY